ncbi:MAG: hypothetical protein Kow0069_04220 [Promethearchaeota archaeon]
MLDLQDLRVLLSIFDEIVGPKPLMGIPGANLDVDAKIARLMDVEYEDAFFVHAVGDVVSANATFHVKNQAARGGDTLLMASVVFGEFRSPERFREALDSFSEELREWSGAADALARASGGSAPVELTKRLKRLHAHARAIVDESFVGQLLVVGLDQAGKTSLLKRVTSPSAFLEGERPTLGVNVLKLVLSELKFRVYDAGGQRKFRDRWFKSVGRPDAVVWVQDLTELEGMRLEEARKEFAKVACWVDSFGADVKPPLFALGNKLDLVEPREELRTEVGEKLGHGVEQEKIFLTSAKTGEGVLRAFRAIVAGLLEPD